MAANADDFVVDKVEASVDESIPEIVYASKYLRILPMDDDEHFALALECGLERKFDVVPNEEYNSVLVNVHLPIPPDTIAQVAGFHAASQLNFASLDETFEFPTPRPISRVDKAVRIWYPNEITPIWVIFKFKLEQDILPEKVEANVNLLSEFMKLGENKEQ